MTFVFKKNGEKTLHDLGGASPVLVFTLSWDNKAKGGLLGALVGMRHQADMDLSCALYDANGDRTDCVWYAQLASKDGAIRHRGDETVGDGHGEDELIIIDLNQLSDDIQTLFFVATCSKGSDMSLAKNAQWRLYDSATKRELARYAFAKSSGNAKILMRLQKETVKGLPSWNVKAFDVEATGQNVQEVFPEIRALIEG